MRPACPNSDPPRVPAAVRRVLPVLLAAGLLLGGRAAHAGSEAEDQVRAVFLYNFALFVSWPETASDAAADAPLRFCVMGNRRLAGLLETVTARERVDGRPIQVAPVRADDGLSDCRLLYVDPQADGALAGLLRELGHAPVLTVGAERSFAEQGGMIALAHVGRRIKPLVNLQAVERVGLTISSKLLRLADLLPAADARGAP